MSGSGRDYRVGVDGLNLAIPRGTGIATYAKGLTYCLSQLGHPVDIVYGLNIAAGSDAGFQEVDFFDQIQGERGGKVPKYPSFAWAKQMFAAYRGFSAFEIPIQGKVVSRHLAGRTPYYDRILNVTDLFSIASRYFRNFGRFMTIHVPDAPRVMHWTYPLPIRLAGAVNIYTIHDLVPLVLPHTTLDHKPTFFRLLTECLRQADHICTVSEASRNDILKFFPRFAPERVTNTYQAVVVPEARLDAGAEAQKLRGAFGLEPRAYFLFFGSIEPKKNIGRLLEAYLSSSLEMPLVLVGARAWKSEAELGLLAAQPPGQRRVRQIEYVTAEVLMTLIRGARAVVFPSLYEGFGLPMLEAMAAGTPVLTSREGSLAEVGGDAVLFVDAYDPADIGRGLVRLAEDDGLCAALRARGLERARMFDMAHYRERVRSMYEKVLASKS